jgi:hypothetical protein
MIDDQQIGVYDVEKILKYSRTRETFWHAEEAGKYG